MITATKPLATDKRDMSWHPEIAQKKNKKKTFTFTALPQLHIF